MMLPILLGLLAIHHTQGFNPCNETAATKAKTITDLYLCYNKTSFTSTVWIPLNSFYIGGYKASDWKGYNWYLSSSDGNNPGWDTVFTYTGNDWIPCKEDKLQGSAKNLSKQLDLTQANDHLILNFNTESNPLLEKPPSSQKRTHLVPTTKKSSTLSGTLAGDSSCYHLTLFIYKSGKDPHHFLSICNNITKEVNTSTSPSSTDITPVLTKGPLSTTMTAVMIVGPKLKSDDWFRITTGITGHTNNWLLLAEQAAQDASDDCMVCLGPRPILRVVPAPIGEDCLTAVMNCTNIGNSNCTKWDRIFPITKQEKRKPIFSRDVTATNHTCINMTGPGERLGSLNASSCLTITEVDPSFKPESRADVWWWCGDPQLYDRLPRNWTGVTVAARPSHQTLSH